MSRTPARRNAAIAALVLVAPLLPGCRCWPTPADHGYREGLRLFLAGRHTRAATQLRAFVSENPTSTHASDAHYFLGAMALKGGNTHEAESHFRSCLGSPRNEQMAASAAIGLARCHCQRGAYRQCIEACRDILRDNPSTPRADEVLFLMGEASEHAGLTSQAHRCYREVAGRFVSGAWAPKAAERLSGKGAALKPTPGGHYTVQVLALGSAAKAAEHATLLRQRGYPARVVVVRSGGRTLHAVRVGPYATRPDAQHVADRLRAEGFSALIKS